jgi:hypothetical protein
VMMGRRMAKSEMNISRPLTATCLPPVGRV